MALAEQHHEMDRAITGHRFEFGILCELGRIHEARIKVGEMAPEVEHLRQPNQMFISLIQSTFLDLVEGRYPSAEKSIASALATGYSKRDEFSCIRSFLFLLRREQGRLDEIEGFVRTSMHDYPWYPLHRAALACLLAEEGRHSDAQLVFDEIARDDFALLYRDCEWLLGTALAADVCAQLGDAEAAAVLYEQLLPFAGRHAVGWAEGGVGAVDRYLGLLAVTQGLLDEAASHFEAAIDIDTASGARPWAAHAQHDYGRLLWLRDRPGDKEAAAPLFAAALDTSRTLGMAALENKLTSLIDDVPAPPQPDRVEAGVFRREGEYWSVAFRKEAFRLRDTKGLQYLARLLANPGREVHVLDLVGVNAGGSRTADTDSELGGDAWGAADDVLDPQARAAYQQRLQELAAELAEAESWNDTERASRIREETEHLTTELTAAMGLGGKSRKTTSASERARVNVTRAIRTAMTRILENDPELGHHLESTVRTGTFCSYVPDSRVPVDWKV